MGAHIDDGFVSTHGPHTQNWILQQQQKNIVFFSNNRIIHINI